MRPNISATGFVRCVFFNKSFVFGKTLVTFLLTAAISHLITQHSAESDLRQCFLDEIERAFDGRRRSMVIYQSCRSAFQRFNRSEQCAVVRRFFVEGDIQLPPDVLQYL